MSANARNTLNAILNPYINQVVGSTPGSIRDSIKLTTLRNDTPAGLQLASLAVFAASVNKKTMEDFAAKDEVASARGPLRSAFSLGGKPNMTALTLLGHALLTSTFYDDVTYVIEFRNKMGVNNLWAAELKKENLSDKQYEIMVEKKRKATAEDARALGRGYGKWVGYDTTSWTSEELLFWGDTGVQAAPASTAVPPARPRSPVVPPAPSRRTSVPASSASPPSTSAGPSTLTDDQILNTVAGEVKAYYLRVTGGNRANLLSSIKKHGTAGFTKTYGELMVNDPEGVAFKTARTAV